MISFLFPFFHLKISFLKKKLIDFYCMHFKLTNNVKKVEFSNNANRKTKCTKIGLIMIKFKIL